MFYRKRIAIALLASFDGELEKLRFQKLLFLFTQIQSRASYHFIPYKYGCYSFQANADMIAMTKTGMIDDTHSSWILKSGQHSDEALTKEDRIVLNRIEHDFGTMDTSELVRYTYLHFPFYAINSLIAHQVLSKTEIAEISSQRPRDATAALFTIGYEGRSLEEFVNILIAHNIKMLCDVRKNAFSMKYGFSKGTLQIACDNVGIDYIHIPDLGIVSSDRKNLVTKADYENLFARYGQTVLRDTVPLQKELALKVQSAGRAALMCFEADPSMCHRSHCASALVANTQLNMPVVHL